MSREVKDQKSGPAWLVVALVVLVGTAPLWMWGLDNLVHDLTPWCIGYSVEC